MKSMTNNIDEMLKTVVLVTGGFDPVHRGHIELLKSSAIMGFLVVGLNSDEWLDRKKGSRFMAIEDRKSVMEQLRSVGNVITFNDDDGSACDAIAKVLEYYPDSQIVFANGGDRTNTNTPEMDRYGKHNRVTFAFGIGGTQKLNSSSWIIKEAVNRATA